MFTVKKKFPILSILAVALCFPGVALAEVHVDKREHKYSAATTTEISVLNLAGSVLLKGTDNDELLVIARLTGEGRNGDDARAAAAKLDLDIKQVDGRVEIVTLYPVSEHDDYVYQRSSGVGALFGWGSRSTTTYLGERVTVRDGGGGLAAHADYEIHVPEGVAVTFDNKVGGISAENVDGRLHLDTSSGGIAIKGGRGDAVLDTGSGEIRVAERSGEVRADTGSGSITVRSVEGDVEADTGSGSVEIADVTGNVRADTGSGGVDLENVTGNVWVDTGSGGVEGRNLRGVRELEIDTGSGSARLDGDFSQLERMDIDTGSGGARIRTSGTLNMRLTVTAGSGGVRVDLPDMKNVRTGRNEFEADIGNAKGRGVIETGSGSVRITSE